MNTQEEDAASTAASAIKELMSGKDKCAEELVKSIAQSVVEQSHATAFSEACERRAAAATGLGADDLHQHQHNKAVNLLSKISPVLVTRYGVLLKTYLSHLQDQTLQDAFAEIKVPELPLHKKTLIYQRMFNNFIDDDDSVSFTTHNKSLLGKVEPKDIFILLMFTFATCRRVKGDNLLQLICSGKKHYFFSEKYFWQNFYTTFLHNILHNFFTQHFYTTFLRDIFTQHFYATFLHNI